MTALGINLRLGLIIFILLISSSIKIAIAQETNSYLKKFDLAYSNQDDTLKLDALIKLSINYQYINLDSCIPIAYRAKVLQEKINAESFIPKVYNALASAYINNQRPDSSLYWLQKTLKALKGKNDLQQIASCFNNFGVYYANQGESSNALSFYNKSLFIREYINDSLGIASSLNNLANLKLRFGYYAEGRFLLLKALKLKLENYDTISIARSYVNLSNIYVSQSNFKKSLQSLKFAEQWISYCGSNSENFSILTNLGATYFYQKDYKNAKIALEKSLEEAINSKSINNQIIAYNNLGEVEDLLGNLQKAESCFLQSSKLCHIVKDLEGEAAAYLGCASVYSNKKDYKSAIQFLNKCIVISKKNDFKPILLLAYEKIYNTYKLTGDYKKAIEVFEKMDVIEDKLFNENSEEKIKNLEFEHELEQKQTEITKLENEKVLAKSISSRNNIIIGLLTFCILGILLILFLVVKSRKAKIIDNLTIKKQAGELEIQATQLKKLNDIKDKTFSILSHDLKSPLVSLQQTLFLLDENQIDKEEFIFLKESLIEKFSTLNQLLENLLNWSKARISGEFNSKPELIQIDQIIQQNIRLFQPQIETKGIKIIAEIDPNQTAFVDNNQLDLVIRNLLNNAIKFSYSGGEIHIQSEIVENIVRLSIQDYGIGMNQKETDQINTGDLGPSKLGTIGEKGTGIGLMISRDFVQQNNGKMSIQSEFGKGTTITIALPATKL